MPPRKFIGWSWNERNRAWLQVTEGNETDLTTWLDRHRETMRANHDTKGAYLMLAKRDGPPQYDPDIMYKGGERIAIYRQAPTVVQPEQADTASTEDAVDLDVINGRDMVAPLSTHCTDNEHIRVHMELGGDQDKATGVTMVITVVNPFAIGDAPPLVQVPVLVADEDAEQAYRLFRKAVVNQIAQVRDEMTPVERELEVLRDYDIPKPTAASLMLESLGRRRIADERSERNDFRFHVAQVIVHTAECPRTPHRTKLRDAEWVELLPQIRKGNLAPEVCRTCRPLGEYGARVNAQLDWSTFNTVPDEFPANIYEDKQSAPLEPNQKRWYWWRFTHMTPRRWDALADHIQWAASEMGYDEPRE